MRALISLTTARHTFRITVTGVGTLENPVARGLAAMRACPALKAQR